MFLSPLEKSLPLLTPHFVQMMNDGQRMCRGRLANSLVMIGTTLSIAVITTDASEMSGARLGGNTLTGRFQ